MTPIRAAVIGAGGIASRHIANLAWFPGVRLVAVADPVIDPSLVASIIQFAGNH